MKVLKFLKETFFLSSLFDIFSGDEHHIISEKGREIIAGNAKECVALSLDLKWHRLKNPDGSYQKVFTGRENGEYIRDALNIDFLESISYKITIFIPTETYSINPSFLEGLFGDSISKLGRDKFMEKFEFVSPNYDYERALNECICRVERMNKV